MSALTRKIGKHIKQKRRARKWTLREVAKRCHMPLTSYFQIEAGIAHTRVDDIGQIAKAFGEDLITFIAPVFQRTHNSENQGQ